MFLSLFIFGWWCGRLSGECSGGGGGGGVGGVGGGWGSFEGIEGSGGGGGWWRSMMR